MSCGGDECSDVLRDVWLFLDDELDPGRRAAVQQHLDECSPCLEQAGIDSKLKALLARKCGGEHAPDGLRSRIAACLVEQRVTVSDAGGTRTVETSSVTIELGPR